MSDSKTSVLQICYILHARTKTVLQNTFCSVRSKLVLQRKLFGSKCFKKTKEQVFDSRKEKEPFIPVTTAQQSVEVVSSFKYLGTVVDSKLSFNDNVVYVYKKAQQRLFLLRKLRSFGVGSHVLESVYRCLVESVLSFNIVTWYGNLSVKNRARLARVVNTAGKIIGVEPK